MWRWTNGIKDTLGMEVHEARELAASQESVKQVGMRMTFLKGATT